MHLVDPLRHPERFTQQADALIRQSAARPGAADPFDAIGARLEASFADVLAGVAPAAPEPPAPAAGGAVVPGAHGLPHSATAFGVASGPLVSYGSVTAPMAGLPSAYGAGMPGMPGMSAMPGLPGMAGIAGLASPAAVPANAAAPGSVGPQLEPLIGEMAAKYEVPAWLVRNVIRQESGGNPNARSPVGAVGLMQLMPGTAAELGVADPYDPRQNVEGGVKYLSRMLKAFDGDMEKAVAAYNAGPGAVQRFGGVPPYDETRTYVRRILGPGPGPA